MSRAKPARKPNDGTISNTERSVLPNRMSSMHPRQERPHGKRYYEKNKEALKERMREYNQRPEVKERRKAATEGVS